jgi:hypothetical protein
LNHTKKAAYAAAISTLILLVMLSSTPIHAQTGTQIHFTVADKFAIPTQNSTITFALNGTYTSATLEDDTWAFKELRFDDPRIPYFDLSGVQNVGDLRVSAQNCNLTVWIYLNVNFSLPISMLNYYVEGNGIQTVNLGLNTTLPTHASEWGVIAGDDVFLSQGQGWTLQPDNTVTVYPPAPGNVTVMHYDFNNPEFQESLPFWLQHYVALLTVIVVAAVIAAAVVIRVRKRKASSK